MGSLFNKQVFSFIKNNNLNLVRLAKILRIVSGKKVTPKMVYDWLETDNGAALIGDRVVAAFLYLEQNADEYNLSVPDPTVTFGIVTDILNSMVERGEVEKTKGGKYKTKNRNNRTDT